MPHVGPVLEGRTFFCPHCGALYSATPSLVPKSEGDAATCIVCIPLYCARGKRLPAAPSFAIGRV